MTRPLAAALVLLASGRARAAAPVTLSFQGCDLPEQQIARIVRANGGEVLEGEQSGATSVEVSCAGGEVIIRWTPPNASAPRTRALDLSTTAPIARPRLLALAIVEVVARPAPPAPAPPPAAIVPPPAQVRAAPPSPPPPTGLRLFAVGYGRVGQVGAVGLGAGVRATGPVGARLRFSADVQGDQGSEDTRAGQATVRNFGGGVAVLWPARLGGFDLAGGLGVRAALTRVSGQVNDPTLLRARTITGPSAGVMGQLVAERSFGGGAVHLGVEAGHVLLPVEGLDGTSRVAGVSGFWAGVVLGFGLAL